MDLVSFEDPVEFKMFEEVMVAGETFYILERLILNLSKKKNGLKWTKILAQIRGLKGVKNYIYFSACSKMDYLLMKI